MTIVLSGTNGIQNVLGSAAAPAESNTTNSNTGVYFPTSTTLGFSTAGTNAVYIDASQNVGIGTSSPGAKLDVNGTIRSKTSTGGIINMDSTAAGTTNTFGSYANAGAAFADFNLSANNTIFLQAGTERMRINSSGELLLATTSTSSFTQTGTLFIGDRGVTDPLQIYRNTTSAAGQIGFNNPNGRVGEIYTTGSATTYSTSSDYRLKENVQPMANALVTVARLKPVTYKWKVDGSDGQGFIAHELQEVVPDCVGGTKDAVDADGNPVYQGVDTSFLVATLTAAIQEQQALITQLTDRIAALEVK